MDTSKRHLTQEINAIISKRYKPNKPGCAAAVVRGTDTIFRRGYGLANIELNVPMKPEMSFRIASMTKQFTAVAILMLVERGKIKLSDRLPALLPNFPAHGQAITVEHLLTHTSGLKRFDTDEPDFVRQQKEDRTVAEVINSFSTRSIRS